MLATALEEFPDFESVTRAALYGRYSDDNQRQESITAQLRYGREYCGRKKYTIVNEYVDEAFTGRNDQRPDFQKMIEDAKRGLFDVVVFHKVDRNMRDEFDYYYNKMKLTKCGVRIEYSAQCIDDSPEGALMENLLVGFAAYYSRNLSKEVLKGMVENALKGLFNGGIPPLGYNIVHKKYVINEYEAGAVRMIVSMYLDGYGYTQIFTAVNAAGYRTKTGKKFGKNSIHGILCNPKYGGRYVFGRQKNKTANGKRNGHAPITEDCIVIDNIIPAIISKTDAERIAEKMKANKHQSGKYSAKQNYLLSGLIFCGVCGAAMQGTHTKSSTGKIHKYYRCGHKVLHGATACNNKGIILDRIEDIVIKKIESEIFNPKTLDVLIDKISSAYEKRANKSDSERETLLKEKSKLMRVMDNLYIPFEEGKADDFDKQRLNNVKSKVIAINEKLAVLDNDPAPYLNRKQVFAVIESYRDAIKNKSAENLHALIENFVDKIIIDETNITIRFKIDFGLSLNGAGEGT